MASSLHVRAVPVTLVLVLGLQACSNLPVKFASDREKAHLARADMGLAVQYLDGVRSSYRTAVEEQMASERHATNALLGGGALMLALAMGGAHRDAIAGSALLAGTGYTLANVNLPRQHVLVRLAGVDALTCAERAVAPLEIAGTRVADLKQALERVTAARVALTVALNRGRVLPRPAQDKQGDGAVLGEALKLGEQALRESDATLRSGQALIGLSAQLARELVAAVNGIDDAVVRSLVNATPDLAAVPGLISGLATLSSSFVPPAGTRDLLRGQVGEAAGNAKSKLARDPANRLAAAAQAILDAVQDLAAREAEARSLMPERATSWPEGALKNCGVANVVTALTVSATTLSFRTGADDRKTLAIRGGVKPYVVVVEGTTMAGLSVQTPRPYDNQIVVEAVGSKLVSAGKVGLRIFDSVPNGAAPLDVDITVESGVVQKTTSNNKSGGGTGTGGAGTGGGTANTALDKLKAKSSFMLDGKAFQMNSIPVQVGDAILVKVKCPAGVVQTRDKMAAAMLTNAGITSQPLPKLQLSAEPAECLPAQATP